ncbi:MAG TPA: hypothetical protein VKA74_15160, partial [Myxococcota bacterium]|nr:hypothetical protein [Myxococcota bacterium]
MRRFRLTLLLAIFALPFQPADASAQQIRLSGSLSEEGTVDVGVLRVMLEAAGQNMEMQSQPAGDFRISLDATSPVFVLMRTASRQFNPFWLEPGADVRFEESGEGEEATLQVTGEGAAGPALLVTGGYEETWKDHLQAAYARTEAGPGGMELARYLDDAAAVHLEMDVFVEDAGLSERYEQILLAEN